MIAVVHVVEIEKQHVFMRLLLRQKIHENATLNNNNKIKIVYISRQLADGRKETTVYSVFFIFNIRIVLKNCSFHL